VHTLECVVVTAYGTWRDVPEDTVRPYKKASPARKKTRTYRVNKAYRARELNQRVTLASEVAITVGDEEPNTKLSVNPP